LWGNGETLEFGFEGLFLTLAMHGTSKLSVFGPALLLRFVLSTRFYIHRNILEMAIRCIIADMETTQTPVWKDSNIEVFAVACSPKDPEDHLDPSNAVLDDDDDGASSCLTDERIRSLWGPRFSKDGKPCFKVENGQIVVSNAQDLFPSFPVLHRASATKVTETCDRERDGDGEIEISSNQSDMADGKVETEEGTDMMEELSEEMRKENRKIVDNYLLSIGTQHPCFKEDPMFADTAITYICRVSDTPGKFLSKKAKELGLKPGPLYGTIPFDSFPFDSFPTCYLMVDYGYMWAGCEGKLVLGESVETAEGRIIHPSDVMEPSTPGPVCS
jgi:hypothetical protein